MSARPTALAERIIDLTGCPRCERAAGRPCAGPTPNRPHSQRAAEACRLAVMHAGCDVCGAPPGLPCVTRSTKERLSTPHAQRLDAMPRPHAPAPAIDGPNVRGLLDTVQSVLVEAGHPVSLARAFVLHLSGFPGGIEMAGARFRQGVEDAAAATRLKLHVSQLEMELAEEKRVRDVQRDDFNKRVIHESGRALGAEMQAATLKAQLRAASVLLRTGFNLNEGE